MKLEQEVIQLLSRRSGLDLTIPRSCALLAHNISESSSQSISATTIRRLLGFEESVGEPYLNTLNIIATYLGYPNWDALNEYVQTLPKSPIALEPSVLCLKSGESITLYDDQHRCYTLTFNGQVKE